MLGSYVVLRFIILGAMENPEPRYIARAFSHLDRRRCGGPNTLIARTPEAPYSQTFLTRRLADCPLLTTVHCPLCDNPHQN